MPPVRTLDNPKELNHIMSVAHRVSMQWNYCCFLLHPYQQLNDSTSSLGSWSVGRRWWPTDYDPLLIMEQQWVTELSHTGPPLHRYSLAPIEHDSTALWAPPEGGKSIHREKSRLWRVAPQSLMHRIVRPTMQKSHATSKTFHGGRVAEDHNIGPSMGGQHDNATQSVSQGSWIHDVQEYRRLHTTTSIKYPWRYPQPTTTGGGKPCKELYSGSHQQSE